VQAVQKASLAAKRVRKALLRKAQAVEKSLIDHNRPEAALRWFAGKVLRHKA